MKKLLLVDKDPRQRLHLGTLLGVRYDVLGPLPEEEPLKAARRLAPDIVWISLPQSGQEEALRLCRLLKTDLAPVRGVVIYGPATGPAPEEVLGTWMADGYLGGDLEMEKIERFLAAVERGEKPRISPPRPASGLLRTLLHRLRRD